MERLPCWETSASSRNTQFLSATESLNDPLQQMGQFVYTLPEIVHRDPPTSRVPLRPLQALRTDIPSRLDAPLLPYPQTLKDYAIHGDASLITGVFDDHHEAVTGVRNCMSENHLTYIGGPCRFTTSIDDLKSFVKLTYSRRGEHLEKASRYSAVRMTQLDLSTLYKSNQSYLEYHSKAPVGLDMLILIQRIRNQMNFTAESRSHSEYESSLTTGAKGEKIIWASNQDYSYVIVMYGQHFSIAHSHCNSVFIGPSTYLDYLFTICDVNNNVGAIISAGEYNAFKEVLRFLTDAVVTYRPHNALVTFFKSYEAYCLFRADIMSSMVVNWVPIIDVVKDMVEQSNLVSDSQISIETALEYLIHNNMAKFGDSLFCNMAYTIQDLTPLELLEASSLHKFTFFSEVDTSEGIHKFLKRTHTKRPVDKEYIRQLVGCTKKEFIISYIRKRDLVPTIEGPEEKAQTIKNYHHNGEASKLDDFPFTWWSDITLGCCLEWEVSEHPVEYAKDKGAIKNDITFGPMDNKRELVQVLESAHYEVDDFLSDIDTSEKEHTIFTTHTYPEPEYIRFPVRLNEKELEQKTSGRHFGVAPARFKHKLSEYMAKAKQVLSYFSGSYMTMSDHQRKEDLHRSAQMILDDDTVAVLLDIEGHNQSMQPDNTEDILEFIGNCYGENGWGKLAHLFSCLTVYHYNYYKSDVIVSKGQLGGIEGWMNPVWSLVTLQQPKMLAVRLGIDVLKVSGYSDDMKILIQLSDKTQEGINRVLSMISQDFMLGGYIVKPSQTAVTGSRVTMLRVHHIGGHRADSTLKRLMAVTTSSGARISAEDLELSAISSAISSALEGSYHLRTATYVKWYKSCIVSHRTFAMLFEEKRESSMLDPASLPIRLSSVLYNTGSPEEGSTQLAAEELARSISERFKAIEFESGGLMAQEILNSWSRKLYRCNLDEVKSINSTDVVLYYLSHDEFLQDLWFYCLAMPQATGGMGVELAVNQALSGHSDSPFRTIYYLHRIMRNQATDPGYFFSALEASLKFYAYNDGTRDEADETHDEVENEKKRHEEHSRYARVVMDKWLLNEHVSTSTSAIHRELVNVMARINKNVRLADLLELSKYSRQIAANIGQIFRNNFSHRVAQFYYENSIMSMITYIIKKLQTCGSLINRIRGIDKLKRKLTVKSRNNLLELLSRKGSTFGAFDKNTDVLTYLLTRRKIICPHINFCDIEEPLYDHLIEESSGVEPIMSVNLSRNTWYQDGKLGYKQGLFLSKTLYKGEISEEETILQSRLEMLAAKVCAVTSWAILRDQIDEQPIKDLEVFDFEAACDFVLSTLCAQTYRDLQPWIPTNLGGEILHRIPNQRFKSSVATRIFPNHTPVINTMLHQTRIFDLKLEDSNINFEYMRMLHLLRFTCDMYYRNILPTNVEYQFKSLENVHIVSTFKPKPIATTYLNTLQPIGIRPRTDLKMTRLTLSATSYLYAEDIVQGLSTSQYLLSNQFLHARDIRNRRICMDYYSDLNKELLAIDMALSNHEQWMPLLVKLKEIDKELRTLSDKELLEQVFSTIAKDLHHRLHDETSKEYKKHFKDRLTLLRETGCDFSETYNSIMNYLHLTRGGDSHGLKARKRSENLERMARSYSELGLELFNDLAFGYCLHLRKSKDQVTLDIDATYNSTIETIYNSTLVDDIPQQLKEMIFLIGQTRLLELIQKNKMRLRRHLKMVSEEQLEGVTVPKVTNIKFPRTNLDMNLIEIPDSICLTNYTGFEIHPESLNEWDIFLSSISVFRQITECYADPVTFTSPTGSDSLLAQYGLLKMLLERRHISPDSLLCSLASGRGDIVLASDLLGLKVKAYARPTLYNKTMVVPEVVTDIDFDLTKPETLRFSDEFDLYIIDVSNITGRSAGFDDTILNYLSAGSEVVFRCNSKREWGKPFVKALIDLNIAVHICHAVSRDLVPYQVYIYFSQEKPTRRTPVSSWVDYPGYRAMCEVWKSLLSYQNLFKRSPEVTYNAVISMLPEDKSLSNLMNAVFTVNTEASSIKALRTILKQGEILEYVHIDHTTYQYMKNRSAGNWATEEEVEGPGCYGMIKQGETSQYDVPGKVHWEQALEYSTQPGAKWYKLRRKNIVPLMARVLSRSHPDPHERSYWKNCLDLHRDGINIIHCTYEECHQLWLECSEKSRQVENATSGKIREALSVLLVARVRHNYDWGIKSLLSNKGDTRHSKKMQRQKLAIYRKLSPLYTSIQSDEINTPEIIQMTDRVEELVVEPLRRTRSQRLRMDAPLNDTELNKRLKDQFDALTRTSFNSIVDGLQDILPTITLDEPSLSQLMGVDHTREINETASDGKVVGSEFIVLETNLISQALDTALGFKAVTDELQLRMDNIFAEMGEVEASTLFRDDWEEPADW